MDELIAELKKMLPLKERTEEGDVVIIVIEKPQTMLYAFVSHIERDTSRRDQWWHLTLHMLTLPPQKMTWTLRSEQMTGREIFTMGGEKRFVQALDFSRETESGPEEDKTAAGPEGRLRLVK